MCQFYLAKFKRRFFVGALVFLNFAGWPTSLRAAQQLGADAAGPEGDRRLLVMAVKPGEQVPPDLAPALTDLVTGRAARAKSLTVISSSEIGQVLNLEGKKQLLGCSQNACLTDIANTMGARYVIFGRVNALGSLKVVQLRLFDASKARFLQRITLRGEDIVALSDQIPASVDSLIGGLLDPSERRALLALRPERKAVSAASSQSDRRHDRGTGQDSNSLLLAGAGSVGLGVLLAAGTGLAGYYYNAQYSDPSLAYPERERAKNTGSMAVIGGGAGSLALLGIGAVLIALGL